MFRHSTERTAALTRFDVTGVRVGMEPSARVWNVEAVLYS